METQGEERRLVLNRIKCLACGAVLTSRFRHDYQTCGCPNQTYTDGGLMYLRYGGVDMTQVQLMCIYSDDSFEVVRESFVWGTYGKDREGPFRYVALRDMSNKHIERIVSEGHIFSKGTIDLFSKELQYRREHEIEVIEA